MINVPAVFFLLRFRMQRLEATEIVQVDYMPKELVTYCKETQTPAAPNLSDGKTRFSPTTSIQPSHMRMFLQFRS